MKPAGPPPGYPATRSATGLRKEALENGHANPTLKTIRAILRALR